MKYLTRFDIFSYGLIIVSVLVILISLVCFYYTAQSL